MFKTLDGIIVHTRADWGARPPRGMDRQVKPFAAVVHHGGEQNPPIVTDHGMRQLLQRWQNFHMDTRGWSDIAYAYLMDGRGHLWQGRDVRMIGAHVILQNTGRLGFCLPQNGLEHGFTPAQEVTFRKLLRVRHRRLGLPALKTFVRDPSPVAGVFGHQEVPGQSTACPGTAIMADLRRIRKEYAR